MKQLIRCGFWCLPPEWQESLKRLHPCFLNLMNPRIPVARWRGKAKGSGQPATLLVAGEQPWVDYFPSRFFAGKAQRELLACFPLWHLDRELARLEPGSDLTVVRAEQVSAPLFFSKTYLTVPGWLNMTGRVPDDPTSAGRASRSVRDDMRLTRRGKLELTISARETDFDVFYQTFYVPFMIRRYGELAVIRDADWLRTRLRRGQVLWMVQRGVRLAACAVEKRKQTLYLLALGVRNGDPGIARQGALAALYYQAIQFAHRLGCSWIDFGAVRPSLSDGLLRFKRKWGTSLVDGQRGNHYSFLIRWREWNPSVAGFLAENSLVYRNQNNGLSAITAIVRDGPATQEDATRTAHLLWTDGLDDLSIVSASGWEPCVKPPVKISLLTRPSCLIGVSQATAIPASVPDGRTEQAATTNPW